MNKRCTVCNHPSRAEIDQGLLTGVSYRALAAHNTASPLRPSAATPGAYFPFSPFPLAAWRGMIILRRAMNRRKLLKKLAQGDLRNISFADMVSLVSGFGFILSRTRGSHHIFSHPDIPELINLQEVGGKAKPYQIRQFLRLIEKYNITLEDQ